MTPRSHQTSLQKTGLNVSAARQLARVNPDALARNLLRWRSDTGSRQQRREMWLLLQNAGSDAVVRRACKTIASTRSDDELEAVLRAATADHWYEAAPAISSRFKREIRRARDSRNARAWNLLHAFAAAALRFEIPLKPNDIRTILKARNQRVRSIGVELIARQEREELLDDCLPLSWVGGDASVFAAEAVAKMGNAQHAGQLWARALSARRSGRQRLLLHLLNALGWMGAFDIQLPLQSWIDEDAASGANVWQYGTIWSRLVAAKIAAGSCTKNEALADLRWFLHAAERTGQAGLTNDGELGPFHIASLLVEIGSNAEALDLLRRVPLRCFPSPAAFPTLSFPEIRSVIMTLKETSANPQDGSIALAWLAAARDPHAQSQLCDKWLAALHKGRLPEYWELRRFFDAEKVAGILKQSLHRSSPVVARQLLAILAGDTITKELVSEIKALSTRHRSGVVRWKARRVLREAEQPCEETPVAVQRWLRLDAAILAGAMRPAQLQRHVDHAASVRKKEEKLGILPPLYPGRGYRLEFSNLSNAARQATVRALTHNSVDHALDRRLPSGPSLEERPDVKAMREPAPPHNEIDERMAELARAVISMWVDGEEQITLDEIGAQMIAAALSADARIFDDEDVAACGAFIGEALRRRAGGQWTGFDENYRLEIGDETLDPIGWARTIHSRKDPVEGTRFVLDTFRRVIECWAPAKKQALGKNPSKAFETAILALGSMAPGTPMTKLLAEARAYAFQIREAHWMTVLNALDPLIEGGFARAAAAVAVYAPGEQFCKAWARWGPRRREEFGLADAIVEAMQAAAERDDLEAMPNWTMAPPHTRMSFLNPLRKRMDAEHWRKVLLLLLRQRAANGDIHGTSWCLYSYRFEFPDCLVLLNLFCDLSVSARQTVVKATMHSTRSEQKLFRTLWAEALRDPAVPVVINALETVIANHARSLRPVIKQLSNDRRTDVCEASKEALRVWEG